jgi:hypothetical protein
MLHDSAICRQALAYTSMQDNPLTFAARDLHSKVIPMNLGLNEFAEAIDSTKAFGARTYKRVLAENC